MEKDALLGPRLRTYALALTLLTVTSSCSFPRFAVLHDPLTPEEHVNLGVSYEKRGELDEALAEYKAAAKKLPLAHLYLGNIYFQQKKFSRAERSYRKAIRKTHASQAYNNLAWLYYTTDAHLDDGERLAAQAVEMSPDTREFRDTLERIKEKRRRE